MSTASEFKDYLLGDVLCDIGTIVARAMFGGYGLYLDGVIFGIIVDDTLYLKTDSTNQDRYSSFGSEPFTYTKNNGKKYSMSYWSIPEDILENREILEDLVFQAADINTKNKALKKSTPKPKQQKTKPRRRRDS